MTEAHDITALLQQPAPLGPGTAVEQRRAFLAALFDGLPGLIDVRGLSPDGGPSLRRFATTVDEALEAVDEAAGAGLNIYIGVATRGSKRNAAGRPDGTKDNLLAARAWWVDVDGLGSPEARAEHEKRVESLPVRPSMRIWSGNGEHLYFSPEEPQPLDTPECIEAFEATLRGLVDYLHGDKAATDASRIMRVPGTWNLPNAEKRALGRNKQKCRLLSVDGEPVDMEAMELFRSRGELLRQARPPAGKPNGEGEVPVGQRHEALKRCAAACRKAGLGDAETRGALRSFNLARCVPPKPDDEVEALADWALKRVATVDAPEAAERVRPFWNPTPHAEPQDGAALLHGVRDTFSKYVTTSPEALTALTLWTALTWVFERFDYAAGLVLSSPEKRCGKTRTLEVATRLVARPIPSSDTSIAALFRAVDEDGAILLLDELDRVKNMERKEDLTRLLNSSVSRCFGWVERCQPSAKRIELRSFCVYGPKAVAGIDRKALPDTFIDRSVHISLQRRAKQKERARLRQDEARFDELRSRLARWASDVGELLGEPDEYDFPEYTSERHEEAWEPMLQIAEAAGGSWPELAAAACAELTRPDEDSDDSWRVALLSDCRRVYWDEPEDRTSIGRERLVSRLKALDEPTRPWAEWGREGRGLSASSLREVLKRYNVSTRRVRDAEDGSVRGFSWADFQDAFEAYLPAGDMSAGGGEEEAP